MNTQTKVTKQPRVVARATLIQKLDTATWIDLAPKGVCLKQVYMAYINKKPYLKLDLENIGVIVLNANEALATMVASTLDMPLPTHPIVCYLRSLDRWGKPFKKTTCEAGTNDVLKFVFRIPDTHPISIHGYILQSVVDAMSYFMNTGKPYDPE